MSFECRAELQIGASSVDLWICAKLKVNHSRAVIILHQDREKNSINTQVKTFLWPCIL